VDNRRVPQRFLGLECEILKEKPADTKATNRESVKDVIRKDCLSISICKLPLI
jgi:hypothetical protein